MSGAAVLDVVPHIYADSLSSVVTPFYTHARAQSIIRSQSTWEQHVARPLNAFMQFTRSRTANLSCASHTPCTLSPFHAESLDPRGKNKQKNQ